MHINSLCQVDVDAVQMLPRLTHLGSNCWGDEEFLGFISKITLILSSSSLAMLLVQAFEPEGTPTHILIGDMWGELATLNDERLLVRPGFDGEGYISLVASGGSIWDDAETKYRDWRGLVNSSESFD
jgi:hypothetical protein